MTVTKPKCQIYSSTLILTLFMQLNHHLQQLSVKVKRKTILNTSFFSFMHQHNNLLWSPLNNYSTNLNFSNLALGYSSDFGTKSQILKYNTWLLELFCHWICMVGDEKKYFRLFDTLAPKGEILTLPVEGKESQGCR